MKKALNTSNIAWRIIDGQAFIINTKTSMLHELDETGTFIWKLIEKGLHSEEIAVELSDSYEVTRENALRDVEEFIDELEKKGILVPDR